jgi:predicted nucleic acid-binding protein
MPAEDSDVVVNTGPLVALAACGQLDLLTAVHRRVVVPQAVAAEFGRGGPGDEAFVVPGWVDVVAVGKPVSPLLLAYLDPGEAEVISLAIELGLPRVLIDERRGRVVARTMGLAVSGSLGVLLKAKREGLLPAIRPSIEAMTAHGVWLSAELCTLVLKEAAER